LTPRRKFLFDCSVLTAATALSPGATLAASVPPAAKALTRNDFSSGVFARHLNTPFRIQSGADRSISVTLVEVRVPPALPLASGRRSPEDAGHEQFTLIFSGASRELLGQETYSIEHARLGRFELFLVPGFARNPAKIDYAAVISRLQKPGVQFALR
jgi:hypothetical protein